MLPDAVLTKLLDPTLIAGVLAFLTLLVNQIISGWTASRNRHWDREDRERTAEQVRLAFESSRRERVQNFEKIVTAVEAVGASADLAYKEANHVNLKIHKAVQASTVAEKLQATTEQIDAQVQRIAAVIAPDGTNKYVDLSPASAETRHAIANWLQSAGEKPLADLLERLKAIEHGKIPPVSPAK